MGEQEIDLEQEAVVVSTGGGAVNSVNGKIGDVVLTTSDLENTSDYQNGTQVENAINTAIYTDPSAKTKVQLGADSANTGANSVAIGKGAKAENSATVAIGTNADAKGQASYAIGGKAEGGWSQTFGAGAKASGDDSIAIGASSTALGLSSIALGYKSKATLQGEINVGLDGRTEGYNNTSYRLISGVHDGQNAHDAATVGQLSGKQDTLTAGSNITISNNTISAADTTYSDFTGTDGASAGTAGLVPAPATTDTDKYLKSDGTWATVSGGGSGPTVVQTTGTSTTDVMSQNAVTSMVFSDPSTGYNVSIGNVNAGSNAVSIGRSAYGDGNSSVAIGQNSNTYGGQHAVAAGMQARARKEG